MRKYDQIIKLYAEEAEVEPIAPEGETEEVYDTEIPVDDIDLEGIEKLRQALLINRDEIDSDELDMIYSPVDSSNSTEISAAIDSIISKSIENIGKVTPSGHY
jgi:hypothetical protein